ncbi:hypothetical protein Syun_012890 [Stephania yunnanensis]|uniref:Uncharacterized protein n=1 Tax=Stephania yunnanensis TaxID=152371 RepID=A0AAP0K2H5_9MAGN
METGKVFKVNGHRLKIFYEDFPSHDVEVISPATPPILIDDSPSRANDFNQKRYWEAAQTLLSII